MATGAEVVTEVLRELLAAPGPFPSVHFDLDARTEMGPAVEERRQGPCRDPATHGAAGGDLDALTPRFPTSRAGSRVLAASAGSGEMEFFAALPGCEQREVEERRQGPCRDPATHGAAGGDLDALTPRFPTSRAGSRVLAASAGSGEVEFFAALPGCEQREIATTGPLPRLPPSPACCEEHPAHVIAVVDRTGADPRLSPAGAAEGLHRTVTGPDDEIGRNPPWRHVPDALSASGRGLPGAQRRQGRRDSRHRAREGGCPRPDAGPRRAHPPVPHRAPARLRPTRRVDLLGQRQPQRAVRVDAKTHEAGQEETGPLHSYGEALPPRGHAVEAICPTLRSLAGAQLRTLLVTAAPNARLAAWFGSEPTAIAGVGTAPTEDNKGLIPPPKRPPQETTMTDHAAEHAPSLRPSGRDLESAAERIELLEAQVQALGQAVRALVQGMEDTPDREPDPERPARAARRAHELLLSQHL